MTSERLTAFIVRLLNEWLPAEVARLLIDESESAAIQDSGIPVQAIGSAIERLLVREHLSRGTLEMLLEPELLSPEYVYPADLEILRDVVLSMLGRTAAPIPSVMPATLLCWPELGSLRTTGASCFLVYDRVVKRFMSQLHRRGLSEND